jgi:hypothetical protein
MMKVFGTSIRALINHLFDKFNERGLEIKPEEIRWVLVQTTNIKTGYVTL